ncbi:DUF58 domain-containing protein [Fibrobacterales bacterium]|nr:DUF58 domain-containing protein [Fibrobacterales bacterium]
MFKNWSHKTLPSLIWLWKSYPRNAGKYSILMQFYHLWGEKLSPMGRFLILLTLIATLIEFLPGITPLLLWIGCGLLAFSLSGLFLRRIKMVQLNTHFPHNLEANLVHSLPIQINNQSKKNINAFTLKWFRLPDHVTSKNPNTEWTELSSQQNLQANLELFFARRGKYELPAPTLLIPDPMGLLNRRFRPKDYQEVFILPTPHPLQNSAQLKKQLDLQFPTQNKSSFNSNPLEFSHTREYNTGDDFRKIHHRAWAKRGPQSKPIVRENAKESPQKKVDFYIDLNPVDFHHNRLLEPLLSVAYGLIKLWRERGYAINLHVQNEVVSEAALQNQKLCMLKWSKKELAFNFDLPKASESKIFVLGVGPSKLKTSTSNHFRLQIEAQESANFQNLLDSNVWKMASYEF